MKQFKFSKLLKATAASILLLAMVGCNNTGPGNGVVPEKETATPAPTTVANETAEPTPDTVEPTAKEPESTTSPIRIAALKGPTAMGLVQLMNANEEGTSSSPYEFEIMGTADEISAKIIKGELDIAAVPVNLASILYNKTEGAIKMLNINTLGVLYVLDTTDTVKSIDDLKGKTVYSVGQGTTPDFVFNYILEQNNLLDEVTVEFKTEATELATLLASGQGDIAILPEPFATTVLMQNENTKIALSLTDEWNKVQPEFKLLTGSIIARKEFVEQNKDAVDMFLKEYSASVDYINTNLDDGAALVEKYGIVPKAPIAKAAIPRCNIVFISGEEMQKDIVGYLGVLFGANPQSVGGKLPDEQFYYIP